MIIFKIKQSMIKCKFEDGGEGNLRHTVTHILALNKRKILLVKRALSLHDGGKWGFPGGFLDQDETLEKGALRELMEETGYKGEVVALFRINSNPERKDYGRQNVAHEFLVKVGEKTGTPDCEQTEVVWYDIDSIEPEMMAFDHYKTVELLRKYFEQKFPLPIVE
jgi:8-oxo-dGTP diphosphatase